MALIKISGPVGNFREETRVTSTQTNYAGHTRIRSEKEVSFRVGNRPVTMKNIKGIELADGDQVTVVGSDTRGGVNALLIHNETTDMIYGHATWVIALWALALTIGGFATLGVFVGFILLPLGVYMFYKAYQLSQAYQMMST